MGVKNFKRLLISIPKCIELNSELILILGLGLGSHTEPKSNIYFFQGEMSDCNIYHKINQLNNEIKQLIDNQGESSPGEKDNSPRDKKKTNYK